MVTLEEAMKENEKLRAENCQQRRLVQGLRQQVARLLDEVARLDAKSRKKRGRRKKKKSKAANSTSGAEKKAPKAPPRKPQTSNKDKRVPRREPLPDHLDRNIEHHAAQPFL
jgi:septal ring factor EnvC (AmiA/AmiB activator)